MLVDILISPLCYIQNKLEYHSLLFSSHYMLYQCLIGSSIWRLKAYFLLVFVYYNLHTCFTFFIYVLLLAIFMFFYLMYRCIWRLGWCMGRRRVSIYMTLIWLVPVELKSSLEACIVPWQLSSETGKWTCQIKISCWGTMAMFRSKSWYCSTRVSAWRYIWPWSKVSVRN